jgi:hypothetical protein
MAGLLQETESNLGRNRCLRRELAHPALAFGQDRGDHEHRVLGGNERSHRRFTVAARLAFLSGIQPAT